jgi:hypothetical protein
MGIIDGRPLGLGEVDARQAQLESDVIFGCVFLGLMRDALQDGVVLRWDLESGDPAVTAAHVKELQQVLGRLQDLTGVDAPRIEAGRSPQYDDGRVSQVAIAATARPLSQQASDEARQPIEWSPKVAAHIRTLLDTHALMRPEPPTVPGAFAGIDEEFGAYYGIVDAADNVVPKVISSTRRLIPYASEGGRWDRQVACHGLIGYDDPRRAGTARQAPKQAGSIEPTELISRWDGQGEVCGYCHGMVWAVAEVRCDFPKGRPFELALGAKTHKLSSCFGCSTFLHANGYAPSSMHLGRSDSWVPLPEGPDATAPFSTSKTKETADRKVFAGLNGTWAEKVSGWLTSGVHRVVEAPEGRFPAGVVKTAWRLMEASSERHQARAMANLFLDALTVHDKDLVRLKRFVGL